VYLLVSVFVYRCQAGAEGVSGLVFFVIFFICGPVRICALLCTDRKRRWKKGKWGDSCKMQIGAWHAFRQLWYAKADDGFILNFDLSGLCRSTAETIYLFMYVYKLSMKFNAKYLWKGIYLSCF